VPTGGICHRLGGKSKPASRGHLKDTTLWCVGGGVYGGGGVRSWEMFHKIWGAEGGEGSTERRKIDKASLIKGEISRRRKVGLGGELKGQKKGEGRWG